MYNSKSDDKEHRNQANNSTLLTTCEGRQLITGGFCGIIKPSKFWMVNVLDWSKLIITVLTSSVVGAVVSSLFSEWQKRNDYKRDYYKKIIDHRIAAYEKLSIYLDSVWTKKRSTCLGQETEIYSCFENEDALRNAHKLMFSYCPGVHWYSESVYSNYYNLARYLIDTLDVLNGTKIEKSIQAQNHSIVLNDYIADTICKLKIAIAEDRINFDKVEDFFDSQKQQIKRVK